MHVVYIYVCSHQYMCMWKRSMSESLSSLSSFLHVCVWEPMYLLYCSPPWFCFVLKEWLKEYGAHRLVGLEAQWASEVILSLLASTGITGMCHTWLFIWVLEIWTRDSCLLSSHFTQSSHYSVSLCVYVLSTYVQVKIEHAISIKMNYMIYNKYV